MLSIAQLSHVPWPTGEMCGIMRALPSFFCFRGIPNLAPLRNRINIHTWWGRGNDNAPNPICDHFLWGMGSTAAANLWIKLVSRAPSTVAFLLMGTAL